MQRDKPQKPTDPRRVLRPGTDPDNREMPVAQRILDLAVRLKDRLRFGNRDPLSAYNVPRPVAEMVPGAWLGTAKGALVSHSGQRLTPDVAVFHDASEDPEIEIRCGASVVALSVGPFNGGYLSLAMDLTAALYDGLAPGDILELSCEIGGTERDDLPGGSLVRLNLDPGGAPIQMEQEVDLTQSLMRGVFVLSEMGDTIPSVRAAWIDVVFTGVANSAVELRNCSITRKPEVPI